MQTLRWAATALAAVLAATTAQAQETIKIGMTQPLTGPVAASGNYVAKAPRSRLM